MQAYQLPLYDPKGNSHLNDIWILKCFENAAWVPVAGHMIHWWTVVKMEMNIRVLLNADNFLIV
jgi:hypothetical protein